VELSNREFEKILHIGISLTTEKDSNRLLDSMVESGMEITHCDASTLYLFDNDVLKFRIMKTLSQNVNRGSRGEPIDDIPPVELREENVCAYTAIHRKVINIPDVYDSKMFDFSGPKRYDRVTGYRTQSMLVVPLENRDGELLGVLQMMNAMDREKNVIPFDAQYEMIIRSLGSLMATKLENIQYLWEIKAQLHSFVEAMAIVIDQRTPYNGSHTRNVAQYALLLAEKINKEYEGQRTEEFFDRNRMEKLKLAALLHDIGKVVIPRRIMNRATRLDWGMEGLEGRFRLLNSYYTIDLLKGRISQEAYERETGFLQEALAFIKRIDRAGFLPQEDYERVQELAVHKYVTDTGEEVPYLTEWEREHLSIRKGTLTGQERKEMESHVEMTFRILSKVHFNKYYKDVPLWASEHHEYLDGSGYPNHLTGDDLALEARILAIVDIYDALTANDRPYKPAMPAEKAFGILREMVEEGKLDGWLVGLLDEAIRERAGEKKEAAGRRGAEQ